jgi:hypothetical protein
MSSTTTTELEYALAEEDISLDEAEDEEEEFQLATPEPLDIQTVLDPNFDNKQFLIHHGDANTDHAEAVRLSARSPSNPSAAAVIPPSSSSSFHSKSQRSSILQAEAQSRHIKSLELDYYHKLNEKNTILAQLQAEKEKLNEFRAQSLAPELNAAQQNNLKLSLQRQQQLVESTKSYLTEVDLAVDRIHFQLSQLQGLKSQLNQFHAEQRSINHRNNEIKLQQHEKKLKLRSKFLQNIQETQQINAEIAAETAQKLRRINEISYERSLQRLSANLSRSSAVDREFQALINEKTLHKAHNLIQLKAKIELENSKDTAKIQQKKAKKAKKEAERAQERAELEASGHNADAIFLARDEAERQAQLQRQIRANQSVVAEKIRREIEISEKSHRKAEKLAQLELYSKEAEHRTRGYNILDLEIAKNRRSQLRKEGKLAQNQLKNKELAERLRETEEKMAVEQLRDENSGEESPMEKGLANSPRHRPNLSISTQRISQNAVENAEITVKSGENGENLAPVAPEKPPLQHKTNQYIKLAQERALDKALQLKNQGLQRGQSKVVCGKAYTSVSPFISDPPALNFTDFLPRNTYSATLLLTNTSFTFNSLKVLPIPPEFYDFFEISYECPGRMSAGTSFPIKVTFKPQQNHDFSTVLPFLSESGPFSVPISCKTRKVAVEIGQKSVELGKIVLGEKGKSAILVQNKGALGVGWRIIKILEPNGLNSAENIAESKEIRAENAEDTPNQGNSALQRTNFTVDWNKTGEIDQTIVINAENLLEIHRNQDNHGELEANLMSSRANDLFSQLEVPLEGWLDGYSSLEIPITFTPSAVGAFSAQIQLEFGPQESQSAEFRLLQWASPASFPLTLLGQGLSVPVYVENPSVAFQSCIFGKFYRSSLRVSNRSNQAHKVQMKIPRKLRGILSFSPKIAFIQAQSSMEIQLKLQGSPENTEKLVDSQGNFNVQAEIRAVGQVLPIFYTISGRFITNNIELSSNFIDFGAVFLGETALHTIKLENHSPLLQQLYFPSLPAEISLLPGQGFLSIPPRRSAPLNFLYCPRSTADFSAEITGHSKLGQHFSVKVTGRGRSAPLELQFNEISFPATANREKSFLSTEITNNSSEIYCVELILPQNKDPPGTFHTANSFLSAFPRSFQLNPGEIRRVELQFHPNIGVNSPAVVEKGSEILEISESSAALTIIRSPPGHNGATSRSGGGISPVNSSGARKTKKQREVEAKQREEEEKKRLEGVKLAQLEAAKLVEQEKQRQEAENHEIEAREAQNLIFPSNSVAEITELTYSDQVSSENSEDWSRHARYRVPIWFKRASSPSSAARFVTLEVQTTVILPVLAVSPEVLDFGVISTDKSSVKTVELTNLSEKSLEISLGKGQIIGNFTILSPLPLLLPNSSAVLAVEFAPRRERRCAQEISFLCNGIPGGKASLTLLGQCLRSNLTLNGLESAEKGISRLDLGDLLYSVGQASCSKQFSLTNNAKFPFLYDFSKISPLSEKNFTGKSEFYVIPATGAVNSGETQLFSVFFSPDHASASEFRAKFSCGELDLLLSGRCHYSPLYLRENLLENQPNWLVSAQNSQNSAQETVLLEGKLHYQSALAFLDCERTQLANSTAGLLWPALLPANNNSNMGEKSSGSSGSGGGAEANKGGKKRGAEESSLPTLNLTINFDGNQLNPANPAQLMRKLHVGCSLGIEKEFSHCSYEVSIKKLGISPYEALFSAHPTAETVKSGEENAISFFFNTAEYAKLMANDAELGSLHVERVIRGAARILLKNSNVSSQAVEVNLVVATN